MRLTCLSAALLCGLSCVPAQAQSATSPDSAWTVGLGLSFGHSAYRSYNNKVLPLPMIRYEGKSFYMQGVTLGYRLFKTDEDQFSIIASPMGERFLHQDTHDPHLRLLSDRNISGLAGVAWRHHADWGTLQASAQKEFTGHGGGSVFDASYSYTLTEGAVRITPSMGAAYNSSAMNDYYYGISPAESVRSALPAYHPGGGVSPYLGIVATYQLSHAWLMSAGLRYSVLPSSIKNSPMVDASHTQSYFFALSYIF